MYLREMNIKGSIKIAATKIVSCSVWGVISVVSKMGK